MNYSHKNRRYHVSVHGELWTKLSERCRQDGLRMSHVVDALINRHLNRLEDRRALPANP